MMATSPIPMYQLEPNIGDPEISRLIKIEPQAVAYWAHCESGLRSLEFIQWISEQLDLLDAIDPECSK